MIATQWIAVPPLKSEVRFVGPAWIAWLLLKTHGTVIPPIIGYPAYVIMTLCGARLEVRPLKGAQ